MVVAAMYGNQIRICHISYLIPITSYHADYYHVLNAFLGSVQEEAYLAYAERRFQDAVDLLTECIIAEPGSVRWREMRGEVRK